MPVKQPTDFKLSIHPQQIIRTPAFTIEDSLPEKWEVLKTLIEEASPEFYQTLRNLNLNELSNKYNKVHFSIWKYFNRAKFRAVPFGRFAAVSIIQNCDTSNCTNVILNEQLSVHVFTDWDEKETIAEYGKTLIANAGWLVTNATLYVAAGNYRFISQSNGFFEISYIDQFEELQAVLELCRIKQRKSDLYEMLSQKFRLTIGSITNLLVQLVDYQLLWTDRTPNITGEDYFSRLNQLRQDSGSTTYTIAERKYLHGTISNEPLKELPELISFLNKYLPYQSNVHLDEFRKAFVKKFDRQAIPLSIALDPELGIGYANLESGHGSTDHIHFKDVFDISPTQSEKQISLNPLLLFIITQSSKNRVVNLEEFIVKQENKSPLLPNTFSVIYHTWESKTVIEHIGGCTANALLGRFTFCGEDFELLGKQIAVIEQNANPETLFFDVSYQSEKHIDNINRRKQLYQHELPLFTWSTLPDQFRLEDIYVSVQGSEILLHSEKLGKRLVPRIPTAYNYTRSDLGVYRFLSDLQHQNLRSDLSLPIRQFIPGQSHYARIIYKSIILSPETWLVPNQAILKGNDEDCLETLAIWLTNQNIDFSFQAGRGDQKLTFDPENKDDLSAFLLYCRQNHESDIYITESLLAKETGIRNNSGNAYHGQLLATCYHNKEIYKQAEKLPDLNRLLNNNRERSISPGSNWLYFEVYCHPTRANEILLKKIKKYLNTAKKLIYKWFFIRYTENGHHLRLRLHLRQNHHDTELIRSMHILLTEELEAGLVSDIQIKTYVREVERYGKERMTQAECCFWEDSKYVLSLIEHTNEIEELYLFTLKRMDMLIQKAFSETAKQIDFVTSMSAKFSSEFGLTQRAFKAINRHYEHIRQNIKRNSKNNDFLFKHLKTYVTIFNCCTNEDEKVSLLADLLHMHINRVFSSDQRKHEAILYQYLLKDMKRRQKDSVQTAEYLKKQ